MLPIVPFFWCTVDNITVVNMESIWKSCEELRKEIVQKSDSKLISN